jgi:hypothetical protein
MRFVYNGEVDKMLFDITPVDYREDGAQLAECFADLPGMVFLDGRSGSAPGAGWDLIAALPEHVLRISDYEFHAHRWFDAIDDALNAGEYAPAPDGWPFAPGAIGFSGLRQCSQVARCGEIQ